MHILIRRKYDTTGTVPPLDSVHNPLKLNLTTVVAFKVIPRYDAGLALAHVDRIRALFP